MTQEIQTPYQNNPVLRETFQALLKGRYYRASGKKEYDFSGITKALQENPHLVDSQDETGNTLLHILAKHQGDSIKGLSFETLFKMGANPFIQNTGGLTPRGLISLQSFPNEYGKLASYESAFQAAKMGLALKALKDILSHQTYQKDEVLNSVEVMGDYWQPEVVKSARIALDYVALALIGNRQNSEG